MKRIVTITALICLAFTIQAQPYTAQEEDNIQASIMQRSTHRLGAVFVGYDVNWLNNISAYLQKGGYSAKEAQGNGNAWQSYFKPTSAKRSANAFIKVTASYDKDMKVKDVLITGTADELIDLFVFYWEDTHVSANNLKKGGYIYQDFGSDRITFDWKGTLPKIRIFRSPDAANITFNAPRK